MIRILLAEDHPIMLDGLKLVFEDEDDIEIVDCVANGLEILSCLKKEQQPINVILTDIMMPEMDGLEAVGTIVKSKKHPTTHFIFYSLKTDEATIGKAIELGVQGYLDKGCSSEEILQAVRSIAEKGESYFSKEVEKIVPAAKALMEKMPSPREREILTYVERGFQDSEIATSLYLSPYTVRDHLKNLRKKYEVGNKQELIHLLQKKGIL